MEDYRAGRWTIKACPKCGAQEADPPRDCDHCERGGRLWDVEVVPASRLEGAVATIARLEAELRDIAAANPVDLAHDPTWSQRERHRAALRAIRGSDAWPELSAAHELGGTSGGRYKSEIARVALESDEPGTEMWRCPVDNTAWPTPTRLTGWGCPDCGAWMEKVEGRDA